MFYCTIVVINIYGTQHRNFFANPLSTFKGKSGITFDVFAVRNVPTICRSFDAFESIFLQFRRTKSNCFA